MPRTLIETEEYTAQLHDFVRRYSVEAIESTLQGLLWGIATNPDLQSYGFPRKRNTSSMIRMMTTTSSRKNARPWWYWSIMKP
jgi:hypothetical protein